MEISGFQCMYVSVCLYVALARLLTTTQIKLTSSIYCYMNGLSNLTICYALSYKGLTYWQY